LLYLQVSDLWAAAKSQPLSVWAIIIYFLFEYVRPQTIYPAIDFIPWAEGALAATIILYSLEGMKARRLIGLDGLLGLFSLVLLLSSLTAVYPSASFAAFKVYVNWVLVYVFLTLIVDTRTKYLLFYIAFLLYSLKMSQHGTRTFISRGFSFASWGATGAPGWFQNSGEFAIQMCIFLPLSYYFARGVRHRVQKWKYWLLMIMPGTALISLIASSSRGGQLGGACVILFMILQSRHRVRGIVVAILVLAAMWQIMPVPQKERFNTMGSDKTSVSRLTYWRRGRDIADDFPLLGIGYNNWMPYYTTHYGEGQLPHNIFIQAGAELGYSGLAAFFLMLVGTFVTNFKTRKLLSRIGDDDWAPLLRTMAFGLDAALVGFVASGFFVTVLYYPFFWVNLAMTATLYLVVLRELRRKQSRSTRARSHVHEQQRGMSTA